MVKRRAGIALVIASGLVWPGLACAQAVVTFPDDTIRTFQGLAAQWLPALSAAATNTFYILALISFVWVLARLAMSGAVMEEIVTELIGVILFIGIGFFALTNGPMLLNAIINSFRTVGRNATGIGMAPSDILAAGLAISDGILQQSSLWNPAIAVGLFIFAGIILVCIALIVGCVVLGLIQAAVFIPIATFMFALFGSYWTRDIAMTVLKQAFAVGAKLLMLQLLAGASLQILRGMPGVATNFTAPAAGQLIVSVAIIALLVKQLPDWIESVVGGAPLGHAHTFQRAGQAVAGLAGAGLVGAAGTAAAVVSAGRLAGTQMTAAEGGNPQSMGERTAALVGGTTKNLAQAAAMDVGRRLSGIPGAHHGSAPWRMAADLGNKRRLLSDDMNKPRP